MQYRRSNCDFMGSTHRKYTAACMQLMGNGCSAALDVQNAPERLLLLMFSGQKKCLCEGAWENAAIKMAENKLSVKVCEYSFTDL
jgi:hypothetical protein